MIDLDTAIAMRDTFAAACTSAPTVHLRSEMAARRREWHRAVELLDMLLDDDEGDDPRWGIEMVATVAPFMRIAIEDHEGQTTSVSVERVLIRDGGAAIAYSDPRTGQTRWINYVTPTSPAVVLQR